MSPRKSLGSCLALLLSLPAAFGTPVAATAENVTCARCDEDAHGFASLNGGTTGGWGGRIVTARSHAELVQYANVTEPLVIRVEGELQSEPRGYEVPIRSNKTIIGVGAGAAIVGGGFGITNQSNIILRNLRVSDTYIPEDYNGKSEDWDGIQVDNGTNLWIDHVEFARMADGLMDLRKDTDYVTVSNCLFSSHNKAFGIGWTPNVISKMTINDNFFNSTNQRNPSADNLLMCHMYNNYFLNVTSYGNYARGHTALLVETSYFENVNDPVVAGPNATIRSNWLKFKDCTGETHVDVEGASVFNASDYYEYSLKDPYDLPTTTPPFVGPRDDIGI
ncbi:pectate lyase Pel-34K (ricin B lectin) [Colletotrichum plurivorum]|uniref:Pectate lyase Pel-34K (Ricin B lectin) n=1 Tax=Colletotrichum plurivorum TaxID=2175906 RepID=A0A8H6NPW5_9PEZI|nr:pectate lyase Pel-34K (ricin B lectin) [Colletotrichum plurivorum]